MAACQSPGDSRVEQVELGARNFLQLDPLSPGRKPEADEGVDKGAEVPLNGWTRHRGVSRQPRDVRIQDVDCERRLRLDLGKQPETQDLLRFEIPAQLRGGERKKLPIDRAACQEVGVGTLESPGAGPAEGEAIAATVFHHQGLDLVEQGGQALHLIDDHPCSVRPRLDLLAKRNRVVLSAPEAFAFATDRTTGLPGEGF